jgi:hypothetical protein
MYYSTHNAYLQFQNALFQPDVGLQFVRGTSAGKTLAESGKKTINIKKLHGTRYQKRTLLIVMRRLKLVHGECFKLWDLIMSHAVIKI